MRIGVVVPRLLGGGAAQCVVDLSIGMEDVGLRPIVISLEHGGYLADELSSRGITVIGPLKKTGNEPRGPFRLAAVLKEHRVDVAHCHNWGALVDTVIAAKLAGCPVLHTQHGLDYGFSDAPDHLRSRLRTVVKTLACRGVGKVATVSHEVARMVAREWRVPPGRISVVHNGVRIPARGQGLDVRSRWRRELGVAETDVLIGTVAVFRPVKDLHTMLEAMAILTKETPRARLVLMGAGPQKDELQAAVKRLGLESVVHFPGFRRDASQLLPALDVFVLSSLSEGISLALLDAMAAGVPSVATAVGGNVEIIRDPSCGILVAPRSAGELARAILSLMSDAGRRTLLVDGGRRRVEDAFSLRRMVAAYEALYTGLVNERGSGSVFRLPWAKNPSGAAYAGGRE
jgi:glycosyltransferase involved in cell wall biosynthesis